MTRLQRALRLAWLALVVALVGGPGLPASAHGFTSVVYADLSSGGPGVAEVSLELEYDLLVVSAARPDSDDPHFQKKTPAYSVTEPAEQHAIVMRHLDEVAAYVVPRFRLTTGDRECTATLGDEVAMIERDATPYVDLTLSFDCPLGEAHTVSSHLFPDPEGYVTGTTTILAYDLDLTSGSTVLDAEHPTFSTAQAPLERLGLFFRLGAEHLLTGIDHILFLVALIVGSRRLREVVVAATTFTLAHSVTFILAATGLVVAPPALVEPTIALSIAVVGAWYLWRFAAPAPAPAPALAPVRRGPLGLDRSGWLRVGVVFLFGLVHGLGFASALGIDEPWSWRLLWSLLVFNLGIEAVQLAIIAVAYPLLALLRRRSPRVAMWTSAGLAVVVTVAGLVWFVQRIVA